MILKMVACDGRERYREEIVGLCCRCYCCYVVEGYSEVAAIEEKQPMLSGMMLGGQLFVPGGES